MHSKVFEFSSNIIAQHDRMDEFNIPDWFLEGVAQYIDDSDRSEDIKWLQKDLKKYDHLNLSDDGTLTFKDVSDFQKSYFEKRMIELKETVENLTIDEFSSDTSLVVTRMKRLIEDESDYYVYFGGTLMSLDQFVRQMGQYETDTFYIGGTVGYKS